MHFCLSVLIYAPVDVSILSTREHVTCLRRARCCVYGHMKRRKTEDPAAPPHIQPGRLPNPDAIRGRRTFTVQFPHRINTGLSADTVPGAFLRCVKYSWVSCYIVSSSPIYNKSPTPLKLPQVTYEIFKIIILSIYHITLTQRNRLDI